MNNDIIEILSAILDCLSEQNELLNSVNIKLEKILVETTYISEDVKNMR